MANGVPVRLSEALTQRARTAAEVLDRSLTEQVEHWARLGQVVEAAIAAGAVLQLKSKSYDAELGDRLAMADTDLGRANAAALIKKRNAVRYGEGASGDLVKIARSGKRSAVAKR